MSESEVLLKLSCRNEAAQLLVVNGEFRVEKTGLSPLEAKLKPGIYSLKAKVGDAISERTEVLRQRADAYEFELEAPQFESAIPIDGSSSHREYHNGTAGGFTGDATQVVTLGQGAAFVLYVRDSTRTNFDRPEAEKKRYVANFDGFRLLTPNGIELVDFDQAASRNIEYGFIGAQVGLDAGPYVLAWERGEERLCLPAPAVPGFASQIFIRLQPVSEGSIEMRPDFREASYVFDHLASRFSPERKDLEVMETVRLALAKGRNVVDAPVMRQMLTDKFENPMLGLYAAHILLLNEQEIDGKPALNARDIDLLGIIVSNTGKMLGMDFPDVVALAWGYEQHAHKRPDDFGDRPWPELLKELKGPPLLMRSWDLLIKCSQGVATEQFGQIPAFRIAGDLVSAGIYLIWRKRIQKPALESINIEEVTTTASSWIGSAGSSLAAQGYELAKSAVSILPLPLRIALNQEKISATAIRSAKDASGALRILARKYTWNDVFKKLRAVDSGLAQLTGLQRDLVGVFRQVAGDRKLLAGLNEEFVTLLLSSNRLPIEALAEALAGLDDTAAAAV